MERSGDRLITAHWASPPTPLTSHTMVPQPPSSSLLPHHSLGWPRCNEAVVPCGWAAEPEPLPLVRPAGFGPLGLLLPALFSTPLKQELWC